MENGVGVRVDGDSNIGSMKKFNGTNFQIWKFQMTIIFRAKKLLGIVEGIKLGSSFNKEIMEVA